MNKNIKKIELTFEGQNAPVIETKGYEQDKNDIEFITDLSLVVASLLSARMKPEKIQEFNNMTLQTVIRSNARVQEKIISKVSASVNLDD